MAEFSWMQRALFVPPVLLGAAMLVMAPNMKATPPQVDKAAQKKVVRVLKLEPRKIQPYAVGFGHTEPSLEWEAQSELDGAVIWVSEQFKTGNIITKGEEILKLDPSSYQLSIARLEAEVEVSRLTHQTISESLKIAERDYQVQKSEYDRAMKLSATGHISRTEKDKATRELLASQQQLQTLKNNQAINSAQQQVLQAELSLAKRDLEHTVIKAPFDVRITQTHVGLAGYVNKGELMLEADGIEATEVSAQFPLGKMRPLRSAVTTNALDKDIHSNLNAVVELAAGDRLIAWQGKVNRSGGLIDSQTQSQSLVVQIDNPYQQAIPGQKPPLVRGTFVKVTLKSPVLKDQLLLPTTAIHNEHVYVLEEGKLRIRPIQVDFVQGQIAVIKSGLQTGEVVVLSKVFPAVEGMSLQPQPDKNIIKWLDKQTGFSSGKSKQSESKI